MRIRNISRTQRNLNKMFVDYNSVLKRKRSRFQLILRIAFVIGLLAFLSGVISGLTGLNHHQGVVSAQEPVEQFNPVKMKTKVVIIIIAGDSSERRMSEDQEEAKELLKKLGVDNAKQVAE